MFCVYTKCIDADLSCMTVTLPPMTADPAKTYRQQLEDLLVRLEDKAEQLLNADQWNEEALVLTAKLRFLFAEVIGQDHVSLANYLSNNWGYCGFNEERLANGYPFQADKWTDDDQPLGFYHDYLDHVVVEHLRYLPHGWVDVPLHEFKWNVQPVTGQKLLTLLHDYTPIQEVEDVVNACVLAADRERCGEALVITGYLSNQQNLTGGEAVVLQAYKKFNPALIAALIDVEEVK